MKKHINTIQATAMAGLISIVTLLGCQETDYPAAQPSTSGVTSTSALVVNASNAAGITTLFQNTAVGSTLAPGAYTPYSLISVGSAQVRVKGSGGTLGTADLSSLFTFLPNTAYSVFVTDTITRPRVVSANGTVTDAGGVRFLQVTDTLTAPTAGNAKLRYFNLTPDVSTASARLINSAGTSAATLTGRAYRTATGATLRYTSLPAGAYVTQIYSGTAVPASLTATPVASTTVTLAAGKIYTLYSQGLNRAKTVSVGTVVHN